MELYGLDVFLLFNIDYPQCTHEKLVSLDCRSAMEGCWKLEKVLKKYGANRMIVGHTPDKNKSDSTEIKIYSTCPDIEKRNQFYVIDTMISRYMVDGGSFKGNIYALKLMEKQLK